MLFTLFPLVALVVACADNALHAHDGHAHAKREYPQFPLTPPYRPLVWSDFNVLHTTDTHGWLLGHQKPVWPEPNYSGDLGDFASFVTHMKQIAIDKDVDLLLVDSGDLHDGTGLSDGFPPGGVDAHESNKFLERLPYDVMAIGNHELYDYAITYDMYTNFVPSLNGRYLSSNVNITVLDSDGTTVSVPVGNRHAKFTTRKGRTVTSLGVLYDFTGNSANTTVQTVADMVEERWFAEAITEEPDVFVLVGHMPVSNDNWPIVFGAIRAVHPYTPIMIFGGHSHIRDCQQYDGRVMALESGRYMETIGWMSANLDAAKGNTDNVTFTRRYLDQNRVTYEYHSMTSNGTFDTAFGRSITDGLQRLAIDFDLGRAYGAVPHTYTLFRDPYPSNGSVLTLFVDQAAPLALAINNTRAGVPHMIITNSGSVRFDVFEGPFTRNDALTAVPFADAFDYIPNVPLGDAGRVLTALNGGGSGVTKRRRGADVDGASWGRGHVERRYQAWVRDMFFVAEARGAMAGTGLKTPGYVTTDGCPGKGDDTRHTPLPYYPIPDYIGSRAPNPDANDDDDTTTSIDLVFIAFIAGDVLAALNGVQDATTYTPADVLAYGPTLSNAVLGLFAQAMWASRM